MTVALERPAQGVAKEAGAASEEDSHGLHLDVRWRRMLTN
jgi:hypothetical protein